MAEKTPTLQRFITSLDQCLREMSVEEIRAALLVRANELPGVQRNAFLSIFTSTPFTPPGNEMPDTTWPVDDDPLLDEIDAFVAGLASGKYFEGYGWDDEIHDQRSFGDESWVWEMDDLLLGAQDAFLAGELGLARGAYQRLLEAFGLDQETGAFCGPEPAVEMLQTDVPEAEARYLRAIYETTPAAERAAVLAGEWFDVPTGHPVPSLCAVREARHQDLPGLEQFLPAWIAQLRSIGDKGPEVRQLLTEATELYGGVDGLAVLAHDIGPAQAELYLDWVQALRRADRDTDAAAAAREALRTVAPYGETRARIAEQLADVVTDEPDEVLAARTSAWRAAPTQARLLTLHRAATITGQVSQTMAAEVEALEATEHPDRLPGALRAALFLLAGRVEDAVELLHGPPGKNPRRTASRVLVPYLLAAGCAGPQRPEWPSTRLAGLLGSVNQMDLWEWTDVDRPDVSDPTGDEPAPLSALLADRIAIEADDPALRLQRREAALQEVDRQVEVIISAKARGQYARAASLLASCAEAITLEEGAQSGTLFVSQSRDRYPRHVAFRRELDTVIQQTPLVTPPPTRTAR